MASITLTGIGDSWPNGTSVSVYNRPDQPPGGGAPSGTALETEVVAGNAVTFSSVSYGTEYAAYGNGKWIEFRVSGGDTDAVTVRWDSQNQRFVGNGAGLPLSVVSSSQTWVSVKASAYAATGDGATDDATAMQAAINAVNTAGGGVVFMPRGTYIIGSTLTLYSNVTLMGEGVGATVLKLKNSANADMLKSSGFDALVGTNGTGGVQRVGLIGLTVDGNKANNSSGTGVKVYGWALTFRDLIVRNCATDNIQTEWNDTGVPSDQPDMEGHWEAVTTLGAGRDGLNFNGPHDSVIHTLHAVRNARYGVRVGANGLGANFIGCHSWGSTQTYAWYLEGAALLARCIGEGASVAQCLIGVGGVLIDASYFFCNGYTQPQNVGVQIGDGSHSNISSFVLRAKIDRAVDGAVQFLADAGLGTVDCDVYFESGHNGAAFTGTPHASTRMRYRTVTSRTTYPAAYASGIRFSDGGERIPVSSPATAIVFTDDGGTDILTFDARAAQRKLTSPAATPLIVETHLYPRRIVGSSGANAASDLTSCISSSVATTPSQPTPTEVRGSYDCTIGSSPVADGKLMRIFVNATSNYPNRVTANISPRNRLAALAQLYASTSSLFIDVFCAIAPPAPVTGQTGNTTNGSNQLTSVTGSGYAVGQTLTVTGVPTGTTITAIAGGTLTMSANATATATGVTVRADSILSFDYQTVG